MQRSMEPKAASRPVAVFKQGTLPPSPVVAKRSPLRSGQQRRQVSQNMWRQRKVGRSRLVPTPDPTETEAEAEAALRAVPAAAGVVEIDDDDVGDVSLSSLAGKADRRRRSAVATWHEVSKGALHTGLSRSPPGG
jgi:hypothetical protein